MGSWRNHEKNGTMRFQFADGIMSSQNVKKGLSFVSSFGGKEGETLLLSSLSTASDRCRDVIEVVRTYPSTARFETTSRIVDHVAVGCSPGRRLVPYLVLLVVAGTGTGRYVAAGRGRAAAPRQEQDEYDGRDM